MLLMPTQIPLYQEMNALRLGWSMRHVQGLGDIDRVGT
jgi:hypothetical protein